jgi:hypothetical protein
VRPLRVFIDCVAHLRTIFAHVCVLFVYGVFVSARIAVSRIPFKE